jgi:hypothetical protein
MELITGFLAKYAIESLAVVIGGPILAWILGKIPTGKWAKQLNEVGQKLGTKFTAFAAAKIPFYNKFIEPVFIDTLAVIPAFVAGFIVGLKSDNQ